MSCPPGFTVRRPLVCWKAVSYITKYDAHESRKDRQATGGLGGAAALAPQQRGDDRPGSRESRSPGGHRTSRFDLGRRTGDGDVVPACLASRGRDEPVLSQTAGRHVKVAWGGCLADAGGQAGAAALSWSRG